MSNKYDYVIIGGGISGLYASYILSKKYKVILLEKNNKLGGRAEQVNFHGTTIKLGAGILEQKNKHLIKLLNKHKINYIKANSFYHIFNYDTKHIKSKGLTEVEKEHNLLIIKIVKKVKELRENNIKYTHLTFDEFMIKYFNPEDVEQFKLCCPYNDFLDGDIDYHLKYYPITDDLAGIYKIGYIDWEKLISLFKNKIIKNGGTIKLNYEVNKIEKEIINGKTRFIIQDIIANNYNIIANNLILALTLKPLLKITSTPSLGINFRYDKYLGTVPFVRIYSYHKNGHNFQGPSIKNVNIIAEDNPLQKIIPINDKILMACYCDNLNAEFWTEILDNKNKVIETINYYLQKVCQDVTEIDDVYIKYWKEGVHYLKPRKNKKISSILKKLQNPTPNIKVVGELVSKKQGWVEGAISSVNKVIKNL